MHSLLHTLTPLFEIIIIAILLNYLLSFFWNTRSMDLMVGVAAFLLIFAASSFLHLLILHKIMLFVTNTAVIAILIIFQPELRVALSKLSLKTKRERDTTEFDKYLDQLSLSVYRLSEKKIGALIVLENEDSLNEFATSALILNAVFSSELLESIFITTTPLHDGALIVRDTTIVAASAILPLAEENPQTRLLGTRHRAALGISQLTDALIIVISEESGKISIAREGILTRGIKIDRFKGIIRSIFAPTPEPEPEKFKLLEWIRK